MLLVVYRWTTDPLPATQYPHQVDSSHLLHIWNRFHIQLCWRRSFAESSCRRCRRSNSKCSPPNRRGGVHHHPSRTHVTRLNHQPLRTTSPSSFDQLYGGRCLAAHGYFRFPILYQPADIWIRVHGSTPGGCASPHATSCCRVSRINLRESTAPTKPCLLGE